MSDNTITGLLRAIAEQDRAEELLAKTAHALAEAEEAAEDDPAAAARVERYRERHAVAEAAAEAARARRREVEAGLAPREVDRAHALLAGGGRG